jgi:NAD(P)-dependent dehydrogenase (short-subunit alcohol dehydrogenase family)
MIGRARFVPPGDFPMSDTSAVVVGVGPSRGLGAAIARRFAREGLKVTVLGRNADKLNATVAEMRTQGAAVEGVVGDVTDQATMTRVIAEAEARAPIAAAVFNAGGNWPAPFLEIDGKRFEEFWRVNALAGLFFGQAAIRAMLARERGTLIYTGASASLRGRANFVGFASAKAALRAVAQSAAREFGPKGIHVAHVVVDGAIDGERIATLVPQLKQQRGPDGLLDPDAIAENYWTLHAQKRSAWTHEIDVRPWVEAW